MKYAKFSDDFLSYFRLDDGGKTLVLTDKRGYTRAVQLLPYEENPQGDLISREALKEATKSFVDCDGFNPIWQIIDNAPTVETSKIEYKAYNEGFKDGVDQGIKLSERPQGGAV